MESVLEQNLRDSVGTPCSIVRSRSQSLKVYPSCPDLHDHNGRMHIDLMSMMANSQDVHKQSKKRLDDGHWLTSETWLPQEV